MPEGLHLLRHGAAQTGMAVPERVHRDPAHEVEILRHHDHRTNHETSSVDKVLDGDLEAFMTAYLRWRGAPS